jgi:hypothetical protein
MNQNGRKDPKRGITLRAFAAALILLLFMLYSLSPSYTKSFFTDSQSDVVSYTVGSFNCAGFYVISDLCGGKWVIVTIKDQPGFDLDGLLSDPEFDPASDLTISVLYKGQQRLNPLSVYWQIYYEWSGHDWEFTENLLGIFPLGNVSLQAGTDFRLDLNAGGQNEVFLPCEPCGSYCGIGIYCGIRDCRGPHRTPDFCSRYGCDGSTDFGTFYSCTYGPTSAPPPDQRFSMQASMMPAPETEDTEKPSEGEPIEEPEAPPAVTYVDLGLLAQDGDFEGLSGVGGFDSANGFFGFTPIPPDPEEEDSEEEDSEEENSEEEENQSVTPANPVTQVTQVIPANPEIPEIQANPETRANPEKPRTRRTRRTR